MESKVTILRHPVHPILVVFPVALFTMSFIFDILWYFTGNGIWAAVSFYNMIAGIVGALAAAIPGVVDYLKLELSAEVRTKATWHLVLNLTLAGLFVVNAILRWSAYREVPWERAGVPILPFMLSIVGVGMLYVSGYLGGSLVYFHRVGVSEEVPVERRP